MKGINLPEISRTFAFTIPKLPKDVALDLGVSYAICRVIDTVEDSSLENYKKAYLMNLFLESLKDAGKVAECKTALTSVPTKHEGYRKLLGNVPDLVALFNTLPLEIQGTIIRVASKMTEGFGDENVQQINTLEDQNKYCFYAAGIVGYIITEVFGCRGYLTSKEVEEMLPLAKDFGLALQKVNIMKDVMDDVSEGRFYWPKDIIEKHGVTYETLGKDVDKSLLVLKELVKDAKNYIKRSLDYIDRLPYEPEELRVFCGDNLMMAIATLRVIQTPELFVRPVKITRDEVYAIDKEVTKIVKNKESLREFAEKLILEAADKI